MNDIRRRARRLVRDRRKRGTTDMVLDVKAGTGGSKRGSVPRKEREPQGPESRDGCGRTAPVQPRPHPHQEERRMHACWFQDQRGSADIVPRLCEDTRRESPSWSKAGRMIRGDRRPEDVAEHERRKEAATLSQREVAAVRSAQGAVSLDCPARLFDFQPKLCLTLEPTLGERIIGLAVALQGSAVRDRIRRICGNPDLADIGAAGSSNVRFRAGEATSRITGLRCRTRWKVVRRAMC